MEKKNIHNHIKKNKKYLGLNLAKEMKDLYPEKKKKKTFLKEIGENTQKWKDSLNN